MSENLDNFSKNLESLRQVDPILYLALKSFKPNQKYEVFMDNDPANYNIIDSFLCFTDSHNIILWWLRFWSSVQDIWHYGVLFFRFTYYYRCNCNLQGL